MKVTGIHVRDGYVEIQAEGEFTSSGSELMLETALKASALKGGLRLLINLSDVTGTSLTTLDRYRMGMAAARMPKGVKLAVLARPEFVDPERFGAQVARNRGAVLEVFFDEPQALAWLSRKDEPPAPHPEK